MPRSRGGRTAALIQESAANLFYRKGYAATSLREIAGGVGIQVGSLYNHIDGKDDLLRNLMEQIMRDLLAAVRAAVADIEEPTDRLRAGLDCHIRFHATRSRDVFIGNNELRSLPAADRRRVILARDEYEQLLRSLVVAACQRESREAPIDLRLQTYAVLAIGTHVASWYRPDGRLTLDEVVQAYTDMILRQLGLPPMPAEAAS